MIKSPFEKDYVRQFEAVAVSDSSQLVKRLDGGLEILGGRDDDRSQGREWMEMFLKPKVIGRRF
ncbi:MAG TPA: hypothetical protein VGO59_15630 [Verrucomicrobiae bacterium]|jgi:hypothetical protein